MRATSLRKADVAGAFSTGAAGVSEVGIFFIRYAALRSELSRDPYWVGMLHPKKSFSVLEWSWPYLDVAHGAVAKNTALLLRTSRAICQHK